jgi:hypothetical protein
VDWAQIIRRRHRLNSGTSIRSRGENYCRSGMKVENGQQIASPALSRIVNTGPANRRPHPLEGSLGLMIRRIRSRFRHLALILSDIERKNCYTPQIS